MPLNAITLYVYQSLEWPIISDESPSRDHVSRPIFKSLDPEGFRSRLCLEGYRSRSQAYCLETWNIASIWLSKTSKLQRVFSQAQGLQHGARWHQVARTDHVGRSRACSDNMVYSGTFFLVKSRNSTNAAWGKTMTSKITNWFHVDENINNIRRFNFQFI